MEKQDIIKELHRQAAGREACFDAGVAHGVEKAARVGDTAGRWVGDAIRALINRPGSPNG